MMDQWFYVSEGKSVGPVSRVALLRQLEEGELSPETLVWAESLKEWTPARDVRFLQPSTMVEEPIEVESVEESTLPDVMLPSGPQVRPWVRYWARSIDFMCYCVFAGVVLAFTWPAVLAIHQILFGMLLLFVYVFIEAAVLAVWGTTPGKALFRVRLQKSDGSKLTYKDALNRSIRVWMQGEGGGIPVLSLIMQIMAYNRLLNKGTTTWDETGKFTVSHQVIGTGRIGIIVLIFSVFILLMVMGSAG